MTNNNTIAIETLIAYRIAVVNDDYHEQAKLLQLQFVDFDETEMTLVDLFNEYFELLQLHDFETNLCNENKTAKDIVLAKIDTIMYEHSDRIAEFLEFRNDDKNA